MKKIAVIGLGKMGHPIAENFIRKGYEVSVWDREESKADDLVRKGARLDTSPVDAAHSADITFEVTANDESSREVWLGKEGILSAPFAGPRKYLITCATLSVDWVAELAEKAARLKNVSFFDMTMTGGRAGAEAGQLVLLVGGNKAQLVKVKPDLGAIAKDVKYFGPVGSGTKYKLILNMLQAIHIAALGEALRLANKAGLDEKLVGDALAERPGGTTTYLTWRDYQKEPLPINFAVEWIRKDLEYAKRMAKGVDSPLLDEALEQYRHAVKAGYSQSDWTKITRL